MTLHEAQQQLLFQLYHIYSDDEAKNIAELVMEHITGWKRIDRVMNKSLKLLPDTIENLDQYTRELLRHKPVQYVLNEAWFAGMKLYVDENVLIPRPETEELVEWIVKDMRSTGAASPITILDIGTGSGCIALGVKKKLSNAEVHACDVSETALNVAEKNASVQNLSIQFHLFDILSIKENQRLPLFDCIVSNPPYIPLSDKSSMHKNVLDYEPHLALFVENDDPLLFYKAIATFAETNLKSGGSIYFEMHESLGEQVKNVFSSKGYSKIEIRKDMQGKDRMLRITRNTV